MVDCTYHPGREAIAKCSFCNKPVCNSCLSMFDMGFGMAQTDKVGFIATQRLCCIPCIYRNKARFGKIIAGVLSFFFVFYMSVWGIAYLGGNAYMTSLTIPLVIIFLIVISICWYYVRKFDLKAKQWRPSEKMI